MNDYAGKTILIVDDEPVIIMVQSAVLTKNGYNVRTAYSGRQAIALVESNDDVDLVLMDIDLGSGIDGTETAQHILRLRDIPILFVSSHTEPEIVERTEGITSYGYVVKNSGDTVLLASIKMAFRLYEEKIKVKRQSEKLQLLNEEFEAANEELYVAFEELEASNEELSKSQNDIVMSEEKYRRLFDSNNDGICVHEIIYEDGKAVDYRILDVNSVYEQIIGLKRNYVKGKKASEIYGADYPPYLDIYSSVAETEKPVTFDTYFGPMNRHFHISVFSPGKGFFATIFSDITDRVMADSVLRESEMKFRTLFETLTQGIVYQDLSGRIIDANPASEKILGLTHEQIIGRESIDPCWKAVKEDYSDYHGTEHPAMRALATGLPVSDDVMGIYNTLNDEYRWIRIDAHPEFRDGEQKPFRVYTSFTDITERRRGEENLEKAIREKEALLRELQHRVKNNLAMISSLIDLESLRSDNERVSAVLASLKNRIDALGKLYNSLYQTGDLKEIRLDSYVSAIARSIMNTYIKGIHKIKLEQELAPLSVSIREAASIGLIANELIINALKYAFPDGREGVIILGLKAFDSGYELSVADNGVGPAEGFDFETADGSGIMIIRMLIDHMGGTFMFHRGERTEFRLTVPCEEMSDWQAGLSGFS